MTEYGSKADFQKYAISNIGLNEAAIKEWEVNNSMTPYILEETQFRATQIDIFSRLMRDRIIWLSGPVTDVVATVIQAQLMYLDLSDVGPINLYLDTPGGSVKAGLGIVDVMNYVTADVLTLNAGMCASMGSILLGAGAKGKRRTLPHSRVMLHQVSGGAEGNIQDMEITIEEAKKYNDELFKLLGSYTDKTAKQVLKDSQRDYWLTANEAVNYGIVDEIITKRPVKK